MEFVKYNLPGNFPNASSVLHPKDKTITFTYPCDTSNNNCGPITVVLNPGEYLFENWGASGGEPYGGRGGYVSGSLVIEETKRFYLFIGKQGNAEGTQYEDATFNGGGIGGNKGGAQGGGGTDVRLNISDDQSWNDFESLKSRIMVAGGGGGGTGDKNVPGYGGFGGGDIGGDGSDRRNVPVFPHYSITSAKGGTQLFGGPVGTTSQPTKYCGWTIGTFGEGGSQNYSEGCLYPKSWGGGGGGGYYGGAAAAVADHHVGAGGGGSSFVSGHHLCKAINPLSNVSSINHYDHSRHFSGIVFGSPTILNGTSQIPSPYYISKFENPGHFGNGAVRITLKTTIQFTINKKKVPQNRLFWLLSVSLSLEN